MKLLLIEDNLAMQTTLVRSFQRRGMQVVALSEGARVIDRWNASLPDVVVLDLSLPDVDGLELLAQARAAGLTTPVLILTARGAIGDRILGLNSGADDYLPKPFDLDELEARIRALARRAVPANAFDHPTTEYCGLRLDAENGAVYLKGHAMELAPREAALLRSLLARPGQAVAKERLLDLVFPDQAQVQSEAIEVVASRLRKKLAPTDAQLVTLRGLGYLLQPRT